MMKGPQVVAIGAAVWFAAFWFAAVCLAGGCSNSAEDKPGVTTIAPPNCAGIATFGNGGFCDASVDGMAACGPAKRRTCAAARLCFDAPEYAFCACEKDADCQGRTQYINKSRLARDEAPLAAICRGGRCAGAP